MASPRSSLAPLADPVFRSLWIATLVSNLGTWMKDVGVGWLMADRFGQPLMVALVQTFSSLPIFVLALPGGALADSADRRKIIIVTQLWMMIASAIMAVLALTSFLSPWSLLLSVLLLGMGSALNGPAWQAILADIVPAPMFPAAAALNSAGFNIARAVGPALGGMVVALAGPAAAFGLNAISFAGVVERLSKYKSKHVPQPRKPMGKAIMEGLRYARGEKALHAVFLRCIIFILLASVVWSLLPLVAKNFYEGAASSYGGLLGCFGSGAVLGTLALPRLRRELGTRVMVNVTTLLFGLSTIGISAAKSYFLLGMMTFLAGAGWLMTLATLNVSVQAIAPHRFRARTIALYLLIFFGGQSIGSAFWGVLATHMQIPRALALAGSGLVVSLLFVQQLPVPDIDAGFTAPTIHDPAPPVALSPQARG